MLHSETLSHRRREKKRREKIYQSLRPKIKIKPVAGWDLEGEVTVPRDRKSLDYGNVAPSLTSWLILSRLPPNVPVSYQQTAVNMADLGSQLHGTSGHMSILLCTEFQATARGHW